MIGTIITRTEFHARWTYAEITGRHADKYPTSELTQKIVGGAGFESLTDDERDALAEINKKGYREGISWIMPDVTHFRCESWTKEQLLHVYALPFLEGLCGNLGDDGMR